MYRLLTVLLMVSSAFAQSVIDKSDKGLDPEDARAMTQAVLAALGTPSAYFYALRYRMAPGEDREVICGIVGHGGEYAFTYDVPTNEPFLLPREMGGGSGDQLDNQLAEIGC